MRPAQCSTTGAHREGTESQWVTPCSASQPYSRAPSTRTVSGTGSRVAPADQAEKICWTEASKCREAFWVTRLPGPRSVVLKPPTVPG